jgi:hypothetical protein
MKLKDTKLWFDKNERVNRSFELGLGTEVVDCMGNRGIVVKIIPGVNEEDHGAVYVWQSERMGYGADNCEHYSYIGWRRMLRIVK